MSTEDPDTHYQKLPYKYKPEPLNVQQVLSLFFLTINRLTQQRKLSTITTLWLGFLC